jgi:hypothetical protein
MKTEIEHCRDYDPYSACPSLSCGKYNAMRENGVRVCFKNISNSQCFKGSNFTCPYYED